MAHSIILNGISKLSGTNPAGVFGTLKGHMPAVETVEDKPEFSRSVPEAEVLSKAEEIADKFENGFTPDDMEDEVAALTTLIGNL